MKKIVSVLMVAVALMMAAPAQAQLIKFGLKGGMDFTKLDLDAKSYWFLHWPDGRIYFAYYWLGY